jgi:hypothetical protein
MASRVTIRAHNRKIRFSPWRYLNLPDPHSPETVSMDKIQSWDVVLTLV